MRYAATLIAVSDMERSKAFYRDVLGLEVTADFGANVTLGGVLALQTVESWRELIGGRETGFRHNSGCSISRRTTWTACCGGWRASP